MEKPFKKTDLDILLKIFVPGKYILFINDVKSTTLSYPGPFVTETEKDSTTFLVLANFSSDMRSSDENRKYDYIFDFGSLAGQAMKRKNFCFINNADKTLRWIFPADSKSATFLNFYHASGLKARLITMATKLAFGLGLGRFIASGKFSLYYNKPLKVETTIEDIKHDNYSIFTGTVGPNRKLLVELNTKGVSTHFAKWAISENSEKLILNEYLCTQELKKLNLKYVVIPQAEYMEDTTFTIYKNIRPANYSKSAAVSVVHLKALAEVYSKTAVTHSLSAVSEFRQKAQDAINFVSVDERIPASKRIVKLLKQLSVVLESNENIPFATAHFDFTPWNMFSDGEKLYVYDWELSNRKAPILFDLFHYVFRKVF